MTEPFIRNHQHNLIKKQAGLALQAMQTAADPKVIESVKLSAVMKIAEAFPDANDEQLQTLEKLAEMKAEEDIRQYLLALEPYLAPFPQITEAQLKKLFPKTKKLKLPQLSGLDLRRVTYLGWTDIASGRMFLVCFMNGQWYGIEGRFTQTNRKNVCFVCNKHEDVALFSAVSKKRPANASPDYYLSIGNYICVNSDACNRHITETAALETFVRQVTGTNG
jgi:Fibronectin-binding protein (FBP).